MRKNERRRDGRVREAGSERALRERRRRFLLQSQRTHRRSNESGSASRSCWRTRDTELPADNGCWAGTDLPNDESGGARVRLIKRNKPGSELCAHPEGELVELSCVLQG